MRVSDQNISVRTRTRRTGSVRSNDGDSRVESDVDVDVFEDDLLGRVSERRIVELKQRRRNLLCLGEPDEGIEGRSADEKEDLFGTLYARARD